MTTKAPPLSRFMQVDTSTARMRRLWLSVERRLSVMPKHRRHPLLAVVTAVGFIVGALTVYAWFTLGSRAPVTRGATALQTANDELKVEIEDGATMQLSAHTRVYLGTAADHRSSIRLQHGSITCDISRRHRHDFSVTVDDLEVRDTGTRFSVSRDFDTGEINVSVARGSVQIIDPKGVKQSLGAGEHWSRRGTATRAEAVVPTIPTAVAAEPRIDPVDRDVGSTRDAGNHEARTTHDAAREAVEALSPSLLFEQANTARRAGNPAEAGRALQTLITRYPNDTRAGLAALELGRLRMGLLADLPGAVRAFRLALAHAPSAGFREDALAHLIEAYAAQGDASQCVSLRKRYLEEYPSGIHRAMVERRCN